MLDDKDRALLRRMQADPSLTVPELAALAGVTAGQAARRLDRMTDQGGVRGQTACLVYTYDAADELTCVHLGGVRSPDSTLDST